MYLSRFHLIFLNLPQVVDLITIQLFAGPTMHLLIHCLGHVFPVIWSVQFICYLSSNILPYKRTRD